MKIFLVGMPGSGKSTLGKQLAKALKISFVDLDHEIEEQEERDVPEIFTADGESYFRQVESDLLNEWAASNKDFVMATGGGAPCFHDGMKVINGAGTSIFLNVPLENLISRTSTEENRPLLRGNAAERLRFLYESRLPVYRTAAIEMMGDNITLEDVLGRLNIKR